MDYSKEIRNIINEFCNASPASGFEINYLQNATQIMDLYSKTIEIMEDGAKTDDPKLGEIYKQIRNLIDG